MRALLRTDASVAIGTGHVVRCLALAEWLRAAGWTVIFASRAHSGHLGEAVTARGFVTHWLAGGGIAETARPEDGWLDGGWAEDAAATGALIATTRATLVVRDHYALDARWDRAVAAPRLLVIDELADRPHGGDMLLDATCLDGGARYDALLPPDVARFLGPEHAILRSALLAHARAKPMRDAPERPRLLIFMGGVDATGQAQRLARLAAPLTTRTAGIDVAPGSRAARFMPPPGVTLHPASADFDWLMAGADAMLGAGGTNLWERTALALPSLSLAVAPNQRRVLAEAHAAGLTRFVGDADALGDAEIGAAISAFLADRPARAAQAAAAGARMAPRLAEGAPAAVSAPLAAWICGGS